MEMKLNEDLGTELRKMSLENKYLYWTYRNMNLYIEIEN